jgi:alcohol dehydrogenase YqhD (iron-dependent ADH family)
MAYCFKIIGGDVTFLTWVCREIENDQNVASCSVCTLTTHETQAIPISKTITLDGSASESNVAYMMMLLHNETKEDVVNAYIIPSFQRLRRICEYQVVE